MTLLVLLSVKFCFNLQSVVKKKKKEKNKTFIYLSIAIFFKTSLIPIYLALANIIIYSLNIQVEIQKLRLYCDPHQSERETACEIYSVVRPLLHCNLHCTGHSLYSCMRLHV